MGSGPDCETHRSSRCRTTDSSNASNRSLSMPMGLSASGELCRGIDNCRILCIRCFIHYTRHVSRFGYVYFGYYFLRFQKNWRLYIICGAAIRSYIQNAVKSSLISFTAERKRYAYGIVFQFSSTSN